MPQIVFSNDWLTHLSDPYAVLGISLAADDRRVLKQYHTVAKCLHPDRHIGKDAATHAFVGQLVAKLINPAYEQLKQEKHRSEVIALLRIQVQQMVRQGSLIPKSDVARQLMRQPVQTAEVFYEQQVSQLALNLYSSFDRFEGIVNQLRELNLVYLQLKMGAGNQVLREKRTGLVPSVPPTNRVASPPVIIATPEPKSYATRHHDRAKQYLEKGAYDKAIQELRDALRMEASNAEYHALLSYAYLCSNLSGMAAVYCRQALKLEPSHKLANQIAKKLNIQVKSSPETTQSTPNKSSGGLFSRFRR
jgi:curved DNA-binding protein CbpA